MVKRAINAEKSSSYGFLQTMVDELFLYDEEVRRLDVVMAAEAGDFSEDLMEVVTLLPPGTYTRERLCAQLNSIINGHAWGQVYGTVV